MIPLIELDCLLFFAFAFCSDPHRDTVEVTDPQTYKIQTFFKVVHMCCACFSQLLGRSRRGSTNSAVISPQHCENAFSTNCNGPLRFKLKNNWKLPWGNMSIERGTPQIHCKLLLRQILWVDYDLAYLTTTKYYHPAHVWIWKQIWSRVTTKCKGTWSLRHCKNCWKYILQRNQVH